MRIWPRWRSGHLRCRWTIPSFGILLTGFTKPQTTVSCCLGYDRTDMGCLVQIEMPAFPVNGVDVKPNPAAIQIGVGILNNHLGDLNFRVAEKNSQDTSYSLRVVLECDGHQNIIKQYSCIVSQIICCSKPGFHQLEKSM